MENADFAGPGDLERFRDIRWLRNHWSRPIGPQAYYWYLTFESYPELHSLARECQEAISFPYYDLTPSRGLHLTLDRIAIDGDIAEGRLRAIESAAIRACEDTSPFEIDIGSLGGTRGAVGFTASPARIIRALRDMLRAVTLSVYPDMPVRDSEFHPHVAIAYANADGIPAADAIAAVEKMHVTARVSITITEVALVLLERRPRSYSWRVVSRIPLAG
jgi:2'-5' RNA ligase